MIPIDCNKLVNKFQISFCVKHLVPDIYPLKVGNFEKKSYTLGDWIWGTLVFQPLEQDIALCKDKPEQYLEKSKVREKCPAHNRIQVCTSNVSSSMPYEVEDKLKERKAALKLIVNMAT